MHKLSMIVFFFLLFACKSNSKKAGLKIPQEEFKKTLVDLHLLEGSFSPTYFSDDSISENQLKAYDSIFKAHDIEQDVFLHDYEYYVSHYPVDLDSIYTDVLEAIKAKKDSVSHANGSNSRPMELPQEDSLNKLTFEGMENLKK